jgi:hypothetical protein
MRKAQADRDALSLREPEGSCKEFVRHLLYAEAPG